MTSTLTSPRSLAAAAITFALALALFAATRGAAPELRGASPVADPRPAGTSDAAIRALQADVRGGRTGREPELGAAYLQKARETGDLSYYERAETLLRRHPRDAAAVTDLGTLAAARHDFRGALRLARRARVLAPGSLAPYPVLVDALVELGRQGDAERALQYMLDMRPSLPAYARASYVRQLRGDLDGAVQAMRLAVAAGAAAPENVAAVQVLLGDLELARGRRAAAGRAYAEALAGVPAFLPALAGRARLAASAGAVGDAIATMRRVVQRLPLPEHVIALGELELAAGRPAAAARTFALVDAQRTLLAGAGVDTDAELAVFEADHGSTRRGRSLARSAWAAAPGVRSADSFGWALTRSGRPGEGLEWARRALRLGSLDPLFRFHAGIAAAEAGRPGEARRHLRLALAHGLAVHPWQAQRARRVLGARS